MLVVHKIFLHFCHIFDGFLKWSIQKVNCMEVWKIINIYSTCAQLISCIDFRMLKSYFREPVHHNTNVHIQYIPYSSFCSPTHSRLINCIQQFKWFNNHFHKSNNCASTSLRLFAGIIFVLFLDNLGIFTHCEVFEQTAAPAPLQGVYKSLDAVLLS